MEHQPKKDELNEGQRAEANRLYLVTDHAARALTLLAGANVAVTVMVTAYLQGDGGSYHPITVGSTSSHGSEQARVHMDGCTNVIADATAKLVERIREMEKIEAAEKAKQGNA